LFVFEGKIRELGVVRSFELFPPVEILVGFGKEIADVFGHISCDGIETGRGSDSSRVQCIWINADLRVSDIVACQAPTDDSDSQAQTVVLFICYQANSSAIARRRRILLLV
jgi:hypothetical protein